MKKILKQVRNAAIWMLVIALIAYWFTFSIVTMPTNSGSLSRALVLKRFSKNAVKIGDLVWVEFKDDNFKAFRSIRRVEEIRSPDASERMRSSKAIGQAILDMDYKPKYVVSKLDATNETETVIQWRIKGRVVHVFGETR